MYAGIDQYVILAYHQYLFSTWSRQKWGSVETFEIPLNPPLCTSWLVDSKELTNDTQYQANRRTDPAERGELLGMLSFDEVM